MLGLELIHVSKRAPSNEEAETQIQTDITLKWKIPFHEEFKTWKYFTHYWAFCEGNPPVTGGFPSQRSEMWSFGGLFEVSLNKLLNKQSSCWWFETPWCLMWSYCNDLALMGFQQTSFMTNFPESSLCYDHAQTSVLWKKKALTVFW